MKKNITLILLCFVVLVGTDFLFYRWKVSFGSNEILFQTDTVLKAILIFLIVELSVYNRLYSFRSHKLKVAFFIFIPFVFSVHIAQRWIAIDKLYFHFKNKSMDVSGNVFRYDSLLGHRAIPNSKGSYDYYIGDSIRGGMEVLFDSAGHRTVARQYPFLTNEVDLYIGCSFTFGDYIDAKANFTYLTSEKLGCDFINAGVSGYGVGQMIQVADSVLSSQKINRVFIQLSPWLTERSMFPTGPASYGYFHYPYFSSSGDTFDLNYPSYPVSVIKSKKRRQSAISYSERLDFAICEGKQIELLEYYRWKFFLLKMRTGIVPKPATEKRKLEKYIYKKMIELCRSHQAEPIVLKIYYHDENAEELKAFLSKDALVIDADLILDSVQHKSGVPFMNLFGLYHYSNNDSILFNSHPNLYANRLIAEKIIADVLAREPKNTNQPQQSENIRQ